MVAPVIPQLNDHDLEAILEAAAAAGARQRGLDPAAAAAAKSRRCSATGSTRTIRCAPRT